MKNDIWKIIHTFDVMKTCWDFFEVFEYDTPEREAWHENNWHISNTIFVKKPWCSIDESRFNLKSLNNWDINFSVEEIENAYNIKIDKLKKELENLKTFKKESIEKAKELLMEDQKFETLKKSTIYKDYYDDWVDIEEKEDN